MIMKLKDNAKIDLMALSSMGVRLAPINRQPVHTGSQYEMQATSAETNVLNVTATLGLETKVLTKFVADNPIAQYIKGELRKRNIKYEGIEEKADGPWGVRHQINIADAGFGVRGPRVYNDRAGEVGRTIKAEDYDLDRIFSEEGSRIFHISGLIASMSEDTSKACLKIIEKAKKSGTLVSFDLNYRESFWKGRERELATVFHEIAKNADILIGNEEEFQIALGIENLRNEGRNSIDETEDFKSMVEKAAEKYPNISVFATTLREVKSANTHQWGAILRVDGIWYEETPREIEVLDRIGGGDGFVAGMLYGILKGWEPMKWLQFGWASGALAVASLTDYVTPADEEEIWAIYKGNARIKR